MKKQIFNIALSVGLIALFASCNDFLDMEPMSQITPENYYQTVSQVEEFTNQLYTDVLVTHGSNSSTFEIDKNTDNQPATETPGNKYDNTGQWKVSMENSSWSWTKIRNINYGINIIMDNYENGKISGNETYLKQYIGELFFLRACAYFSMLQKWGDLPILTQAIDNDETALIEANKRSPRNEVARFILKDLDLAAEYMTPNFEPRHTRISQDCAYLMKSRVALFEGSWLTNFKDTPFVPNGKGWPGAVKEYNKDYKFPAGDIDKEAQFFFQKAVEAAESVAQKYKHSLTKNTGITPQKVSDINDYFYMFGDDDMSTYPDILLWREYNKGLGITNHLEVIVQGGYDVTRSLVDCFLMEDGRPIYNSSIPYDDQTIAKARSNRDPRLIAFMKQPGQINYFINEDYPADHARKDEAYPPLNVGDGTVNRSLTGYRIRKGGSFDKARCDQWKSYTGSIVFRATEALLNYIEAEYMLTKNIQSGHILEYWKLIRETAGFVGTATDPLITNTYTSMDKEKADWGAYTAGKLLTDVTLYNIRRERRCELMAEGLRWMDLIRWRSLEQMCKEPYHVEGFRLWDVMQNEYDLKPADYDGGKDAFVTSPSRGQYIIAYENIQEQSNLYRNGLHWMMAHYLEPLPIKQFLLTALDHVDIELSPLYQNPYWPLVADTPAEQ